MARATLLGIKATTLLEHYLLDTLQQRTGRIVPVISLATYLARNGLDVEVHHEDAHLYWDALEGDPKQYEEQSERYEEAFVSGVRIVHPIEVDEALLHRLLDTGRLAICGIEYAGSGIKHAVLLYGVAKDGMLLLIDPLSGRVRIAATAQLKRMRTSFGRWCMSVGLRSA